MAKTNLTGFCHCGAQWRGENGVAQAWLSPYTIRLIESFASYPTILPPSAVHHKHRFRSVVATGGMSGSMTNRKMHLNCPLQIGAFSRVSLHGRRRRRFSTAPLFHVIANGLFAIHRALRCFAQNFAQL